MKLNRINLNDDWLMQVNTTGQDLLNVVYQHLNLVETAYFGLRYVDASHQPVSHVSVRFIRHHIITSNSVLINCSFLLLLFSCGVLAMARFQQKGSATTGERWVSVDLLLLRFVICRTVVTFVLLFSPPPILVDLHHNGGLFDLSI